MSALKTLLAATAALALTVTLTGCSTQLPDPKITPIDFRACILSDQNGFTDGGANEAAYNGVLEAKAVLGIQLSAIELSSRHSSEAITKNLEKLTRANCDLIVAAGDAVVTALYESASSHPAQRYLLVDAQLNNSDGSPRELGNVRAVAFDNQTAGFLAGYLAASKTRSGTVGVLTGRITQTTLEYVGGFKKGVQYFNLTQTATVNVIGAEGDSGERWLKVGSFESLGKAQRLATQLIDDGSDVIFAPAGRGSIGALRAAAAAERTADQQPVSVLNTENDSFIDPLYREVRGSLLASITRSTMRQVFESTRAALDGRFTGAAAGSYYGDLTNGGIGLSDEHELSWPNQAATRLDRLKAAILQGEVETR